MSVSILLNKQISCLANFAQEHNLGSASLVGSILLAQNVKTSNARYGENESVEFILSDDAISSGEVYDLASYYLSNSREGLEGSKAYELMVGICKNAIHPLSSSHTLDPLMGLPIRLKSHSFSGTAYILDTVSEYMFEVLLFSLDTNEWVTTHALKSSVVFIEVSQSQLNFQLSIEQVAGIKMAEKNKRVERQLAQEKSIQEEAEVRKEFNLKFAELKPEYAKAVIVAEFKNDECGNGDDYYGSSTARRVLLAFSKHTRNLFPELRKAALNFEPTRSLATTGAESEHRENYSMGRGTFLTEGSTYSGWVISKEVIRNGVIEKAEIINVENSLPPLKTSNPTTAKPVKHTTRNGELTITGSEVRYTLSDNITPDDIEGIKSAGFVQSGSDWVAAKESIPHAFLVRAFNSGRAGIY